MAAIEWSDVEAIAPDLSAVSGDGQTLILAYVNDLHNADELGGEASATLKMARTYLAAHHGALALRGDVGGAVSAESDGDLSRQYASFSPLGTDPKLDSTPYGKAYREVIHASAARGPRLL